MTVRHYLPQGAVTIKAIRTVGCTKDAAGKETLHSASAVTATPTFSRDPSASSTIVLSRLSDVGSNASLNFGFYEDGRLRSINATSEGVGQEVIASAIKIAGLVVGLPGPGLASSFTRACALIKQQQTDDVPVTITAELREAFLPADYAGGGDRWVLLEASPADPSFTRALLPELPLMCVQFGAPATVDPLVAPSGRSAPRDGSAVRLRQAARVPVRVVQETPTAFEARRHDMLDRHGGPAPCGDDVETVWTGAVTVPQLGRTYDVPIPRAALFGKTDFQLALAESGAITTLAYGDTSGAPAVLTSVAGGLAAIQPDSSTARAARVQGEADLIYQQQRQVRCQMDPQNCPAE